VEEQIAHQSVLYAHQRWHEFALKTLDEKYNVVDKGLTELTRANKSLQLLLARLNVANQSLAQFSTAPENATIIKSLSDTINKLIAMNTILGTTIQNLTVQKTSLTSQRVEIVNAIDKSKKAIALVWILTDYKIGLDREQTLSKKVSSLKKNISSIANFIQTKSSDGSWWESNNQDTKSTELKNSYESELKEIEVEMNKLTNRLDTLKSLISSQEKAYSALTWNNKDYQNVDALSQEALNNYYSTVSSYLQGTISDDSSSNPSPSTTDWWENVSEASQ